MHRHGAAVACLPSGAGKLLEQGEDLVVQIHAVMASLGPACRQMAGKIPRPAPAPGSGLPLRQAFGDAPLMGQAEVRWLAEAHGRLHHAVQFQPAMAGIFQDTEATCGFDTEVQQVIGLVRL